MRLVPTGTPSRTDRYVFPRSRAKLFAIWLAAGLAVAAALSVAVFGGAKTLATPGALASAHAPFEKQCAACHAPSVEDVRCEYCHDPFGSNRYQNAGHVWFGTGNSAEAARAAVVDCSRCHADHRGREFPMQRVDERECAACHFRSMERHPEFDLVKAAVMKDEGLLFTHDRHVKEMRKQKLDDCQFCHEPTRDRRGFETLSFDRHCAKCHAPGGSVGATDPMPAQAVVLPEQIGAPWADPLAEKVRRLPRERISMENVAHRDPWILFNLWKLAREVDPEKLASRRAATEKKIAELTFQLQEPPTKGMSLASLQEQERELASRRAALANKPAQDPERGKVERALARIRVQIEIGPLQMTAPRMRDRTELEAELAQRRSELADFDIALGESVSLSADQREARLAAVVAMTSACTKCHVYNGSLMVPVRAAVPVLGHANFDHLPHVQQVNCQACHTSVVGSRKAEDVNLPGVANCQTCHQPGRSRADCAECHTYHPLSEPWPPIE